MIEINFKRQMKYILMACTLLIIVSCKNASPPTQQWTLDHTISLDSIAPNGILVNANEIIIADPTHNSLFQVSEDGALIGQQGNFQRPMHIASLNETIYVSDFLSDSIKTWNGKEIKSLDLPEEPDAPSSVSVSDNSFAVADFYNNRIIYSVDGQNKTFGKEGMEEGDLNYPTDVQIANDRVYVADAYNHRVNVYDLEGVFQFSFGKDEKMNAAVGIFVSDDQVFVCDYENSKVNVYSTEGEYQSNIDQGLSKPSDAYYFNNKLYVINFEGKSISVFSMN